MRTVVVTGSASGMGAATKQRVEAAGDRVIGVDVRDAEVIADLGDAQGRQHAVDAITERVDGCLDGVVTFAGVPGLTDQPADRVVSVNYFGTVDLLTGLRHLLAVGERAAAVVCSSASATTMPGIPLDLVELCLTGDEAGARRAANEVTGVPTYPATKLALARWVRRNAGSPEWAGAGITLNALAPGVVETPMLELARRDPVMGGGMSGYLNPLGRGASPDEMAGLASFLLGPDARFVVGVVLTCDGGTETLTRADDFPSPVT